MADYLPSPNAWQQQDPLVLIVSEAGNAGPAHWQSLWAAKRTDCRQVDLGTWGAPHRDSWTDKLGLAVHHADRPVVLVAHGLGCLAAAWWAEYERPGFGKPVIAALLVAPPDVDRPGRDPWLARFGACSRELLPFPGFLVASHDDPLGSYRTARALARDWGCRFADAGAVGHIDADRGDWPFGEKLLDQLLLEYRRSLQTPDAPGIVPAAYQRPAPMRGAAAL